MLQYFSFVFRNFAYQRHAPPMILAFGTLLALLLGLALGYWAGRQSISELRQGYQRQLQEVERRHRESQETQSRQFDQQLHAVKEQLKGETECLLRERSIQLGEENTRQLSSVLSPLRHGLQEMRAAVENADRRQQETLVRLDESIKTTLMQAKHIGDRADRLAAALTGENKTQGDFGELRLRTLLEKMGFEEGVQFEEQTMLRDNDGNATRHSESGHHLIPDVVLHFPDSRDIVIDSKVSLTAFQEYYVAESDDVKERALHRHVASVRRHVNELSAKGYSIHTEGNARRPDFVVMYMFSDSALSLALTAAPGLWREAYDKGVFITGSQNLYALLRMLELSWTQHRQIENQQRIMDQANLIVSRVQLFYARFLDVEQQFRRTASLLEDVRTVISPEGQSIIAAANKLVKMGAREDRRRKKKLPQNSEGVLADNNPATHTAVE